MTENLSVKPNNSSYEQQLPPGHKPAGAVFHIFLFSKQTNHNDTGHHQQKSQAFPCRDPADRSSQPAELIDNKTSGHGSGKRSDHGDPGSDAPRDKEIRENEERSQNAAQPRPYRNVFLPRRLFSYSGEQTDHKKKDSPHGKRDQRCLDRIIQCGTQPGIDRRLSRTERTDADTDYRRLPGSRSAFRPGFLPGPCDHKHSNKYQRTTHCAQDRQFLHIRHKPSEVVHQQSHNDLTDYGINNGIGTTYPGNEKQVSQQKTDAECTAGPDPEGIPCRPVYRFPYICS